MDEPAREVAVSESDASGPGQGGTEAAIFPSRDRGVWEALIERRVSRLEEEMRDVKSMLRNEVIPYLKDLSKSFAELKGDVAAIKATLPHLATKAELAEVKTELKAEISEVKTELKTEHAESRTEFRSQLGNVREEVAELRGMVSRLPTTLQLGGFVIAIFMVTGIMRTLFGP